MAAGLAVEGTNSAKPRAGDLARKDVPTCRPGDDLAEVRHRVKESGWSACVVVNEERVVMGLLRAEQLAGDANQRVELAMRPGPSTFRPHVPVDEIARFLADHEMPNCPITSSDGRLIGLLMREDAGDPTGSRH